MKTKPVTAVLIGAGSRGKDAYGQYALLYPDRLKFIAVADTNPEKCRIFKEEHHLDDSMVSSLWEALLNEEKGKLADAAFICTPDRHHHAPAMKALDLGYDIVLEKPISPTKEQCHALAKKADDTGRLVLVCHVLRYTPFWKKVKEIIDSGRIGRVIHYEHSENVSYWHYGHSYVRGFYKNKGTSTPIVLAKTCHDLDLMYWILDERARSVHATGELTWYRPENAPDGAPERCTDGCPHSEECPWYAPRLYIEAEPLIRIGYESPNKLIRALTNVALYHKNFIRAMSIFNKKLKTIVNWDQFPATALTTDLTPEGKLKALREGDFGKCIFKSGNDQPDHMVSVFNFPSSVTGTLIMHGLSEYEGRELRVFGTKGVLRGIFRFMFEEIRVTDFRHGNSEILYKSGGTLQGGHGGGDFGLMDAFTSLLRGEGTLESLGISDIHDALESHYMGFAAEESRLTGETQHIADFRL
ncbi:MAG: Gfo/Idh/MocA family protein [Promethearchaeota archaeon]